MNDHRTPLEINEAHFISDDDFWLVGNATPSRHQPSRKALGRMAEAVAAIHLVEALDPAGELGDEALDVALGVLADARLAVEGRLDELAADQPF